MPTLPGPREIAVNKRGLSMFHVATSGGHGAQRSRSPPYKTAHAAQDSGDRRGPREPPQSRSICPHAETSELLTHPGGRTWEAGEPTLLGKPLNSNILTGHSLWQPRETPLQATHFHRTPVHPEPHP